MKRVSIIVILLFAVLSGCSKNTVYGNGISVEEIRDITGKYTTVVANNGVDVVIDRTLPHNRIVIKCDEELLQYVSIRIFFDKLIAGYKNSYTFNTPLKTEIHIPDIAEVSNFQINASELYSPTTVVRDSIMIEADGATIGLATELNYLKIAAGAKSDIQLTGKIHKSNIQLESGTSCYAANCNMEDVNVTLRESTLYVSCDSLLDAVLRNASTLVYRGDCRVNADCSADSRITKE